MNPWQHTEPDSIERARLRVVLATVFINIFAVALLTLAPWSDWRTGIALNLFDNAILLTFVIRRRDHLLARLMLFGLAVGFAELPADAWLVDYTRTLDYSVGGGPMLWRSPIWMPFAWQIVAVQFGYLGLRLREHFGRVGLLMVGVLGALKNVKLSSARAAWRAHLCDRSTCSAPATAGRIWCFRSSGCVR